MKRENFIFEVAEFRDILFWGRKSIALAEGVRLCRLFLVLGIV
jgi:hypothetical protein